MRNDGRVGVDAMDEGAAAGLPQARRRVRRNALLRGVFRAQLVDLPGDAFASSATSGVSIFSRTTAPAGRRAARLASTKMRRAPHPQNQASSLGRMRCDTLQGHFFRKRVAPVEIAALLEYDRELPPAA